MQKEKNRNWLCNADITDLMSLVPAGYPSSLVSGWTKVAASSQFLGRRGGIQALPGFKEKKKKRNISH